MAAPPLTLLVHICNFLSLVLTFDVSPQLRIGLLDWGQTKELSRKDREKVAKLILAVSSHTSPDIVRW